MSTLSDLLAEHTDLPGSAVDHLQRLVGEWQLLADLSFSDLALWVRNEDSGYVCVAQVRPDDGCHGVAGRPGVAEGRRTQLPGGRAGVGDG